MIQYTNYCLVILLLLATNSCKKKTYTIGSLDAPTGVTITTTIAGQDATHPNGDGSGDVNVTVSGKNVLSYYIDYGSGSTVNPKLMSTNQGTYKYTKLGLNTYRITV